MVTGCTLTIQPLHNDLSRNLATPRTEKARGNPSTNKLFNKAVTGVDVYGPSDPNSQVDILSINVKGFERCGKMTRPAGENCCRDG
jgi:hypothetical protein